MGPDENQFDVYKELLCSVSDFFAAALDGGFKEAEAGAVKLPEQNPDTFQYFVHWLYAGKLTGYFRPGSSPSMDELNAPGMVKREVNRRTKYQADRDVMQRLSDAQYLALFEDVPIPELVSLYILADALQIRGLRDHIVNVIAKVYGTEVCRTDAFWRRHEASDDWPQPILIMNDAYDRLPSTSTLRRFIVDLCLTHMAPHAFAPHRGHLSFDFIFDWLAASHTLQMYDFPRLDFREFSSVCDYHEHDGECLLKTRDIIKSGIGEW